LQELEEGREAIQKLMDTLEARKDACLKTTYDGVSKEFRNVFRELVPDGYGDLVLVRQPGAPGEPPGPAVGIKVRAALELSVAALLSCVCSEALRACLLSCPAPRCATCLTHLTPIARR
jgi:hypothetical protein